MVKRPSPLHQVREVAQAREKELALEAGEHSRRQAAEKATLDRLSGYLEEYARASRQGVRRLHDMDNERRFVERLGRAVQQQQVQLRRVEERARQAAQRWHRARAEVEGLTRVIQAREQKEALEQQRRAQRDADARGAVRRTLLPEAFQ